MFVQDMGPKMGPRRVKRAQYGGGKAAEKDKVPYPK